MEPSVYGDASACQIKYTTAPREVKASESEIQGELGMPSRRRRRDWGDPAGIVEDVENVGAELISLPSSPCG